MNFCPNCGKPVEAGQKNCGACGSNLVTPLKSRLEYPPVTNLILKTRKKVWLIAVICAAFIIIAGVAALLILTTFDAAPQDLNGQWDFTMKVEHVIGPDTGLINKNDEGSQRIMGVMLTLDRDGQGTIKMDGIVFNVVYKCGKITAIGMLNGKLAFEFEGRLSKKNGKLGFTGTWVYQDMKSKEKADAASGSWTGVYTGLDNK